MVKELANYLSECDIEVLDLDGLTLPVPKEGEHKILIAPGYNLVEMMEEICEEESLSEYVNKELEQVQRLSMKDVLGKIVASRLSYTDIALEPEELEGKSFEELYRAYSLLWEGSEMLNEEFGESDTEPFDWNTTWVQGKVEEDEQVILLTLPTEAGYEAPLWVPMGGYNECPLPGYQSVIFKHFQQRYQIKIVAVSEDTWILQAGKRPQTHDEALRLAKEHFIFCQYVMDGFSTLGHYADYLMKHDIWYFWWD
ncbi:DUF4253 domain-containing protein [Paenibacillus sp. Y412MC10]|uniref:DUF4253 domain-containing protein n=1 Tax=Geobacillus sp. (strain Y412MC10) TaxID=481743 RepID=UPI00119F17A5|nr:DUF4253 domain-containing protein [Paenibacillus sp. Y412MC10]